jgi:hypothetical protein
MRPGYDRCAQFVSELGESGAPHAALVSFGGFVPIGVLTLLFAFLAIRRVQAAPGGRLGFLLFSGVGWAYLLAAFFPCDPGCPVSGSATQNVHSTLGVVEYLGGGLGIFFVGRSWAGPSSNRGVRWFSAVASLVVGVAFLGMVVPQLASLHGLVQRVAETALFGWVAYVSALLWISDGAPPSP